MKKIVTFAWRNTKSLVRKIMNVLTYHTGVLYTGQIIYDALIL